MTTSVGIAFLLLSLPWLLAAILTGSAMAQFMGYALVGLGAGLELNRPKH